MCMLEHANAGMRVSVLVILARKKKKKERKKRPLVMRGSFLTGKMTIHISMRDVCV